MSKLGDGYKELGHEKSDAEIDAEFKKHLAAERRRYRKATYDWSAGEENKLSIFIEDGLTTKEIAELLDIEKFLVQRRLKELDLWEQQKINQRNKTRRDHYWYKKSLLPACPHCGQSLPDVKKDKS